LRIADSLGGNVGKWRFALRKPPFYPLNYGNRWKDEGRRVKDENPETRFAIADCEQTKYLNEIPVFLIS
jgi:hypothetical protein